MARSKASPDDDTLLASIVADMQKSKAIGDDGEVHILGDGMFKAQPKTWISTGSTLLDLAIGGRGFPLGRLVEIFGPEVTGKSMLLGNILASAQRMGAITALFDAEQAWTVEYAADLCGGLDVSKLALVDVETLEEYWQSCVDFIEKTRKRTDRPIVIGTDSISGYPTKDELGKTFDKETKVAGAAKVNKSAARRLRRRLAHLDASIVVISQVIADPNAAMFAEKTTTSGGKWAAYFASVRIRMQRIGSIKGGDETQGGRLGDIVQATVYKDRFSGAGRKVRIPIYHDGGMDDLRAMIDYLQRAKAFKTGGGGWITFGEHKVQGADALRDVARADPAVREAITQMVRERFTTVEDDDDDVVEAYAPPVVGEEVVQE